jgi:hypothetical protein
LNNRCTWCYSLPAPAAFDRRFSRSLSIVSTFGGAARRLFSEESTMDTNRSSGLLGLARMFWMMGGPALMLFLAAVMVQRGGGWYSPTSIAFLVVMFAVVAIRRLDPHNGYGEPSAPEDLRKHAIVTFGAGLVTWAIANLLGNQLGGS